MSNASDSFTQIPMPSLIGDDEPAIANRDPSTSGDAGPIYDQAELDAAKASVDDTVTRYARKLWTTLDQIAQYLRDDVARGGSGPLIADPQPLPKTDGQWDQWRHAYASVLASLAGPAGDEGYGEQEARLEQQNRRLDPQ